MVPLLLLASLCAPQPPLGPQGANRVQLDNGGELVLWLNDPNVASDPTQGDFSGDFFWKVFPKEVLRHPSGELPLVGLEYRLFDQDWDLDDATLWAWAITRGVDSGDIAGGGTGLAPGNIEPDFSDPSAVFMPAVSPSGLGNPLGAGNCPPPGELAGWVVREIITEVGGEPQAFMDLTADGSADWVYCGFFPPAQSATTGGANCGGGGNASFQYVVSLDAPGAPFGGENAVDVLGTGYSPYGGRNFGDPTGVGFQIYVPNAYDRGAELAFLFGTPTLEIAVDADLDATGAEVGLAALQLPLGLDAAGLPTGTQPHLGWVIHADGSDVSTDVAIAAASLVPPLASPLLVAGGWLGLDPAPASFATTIGAFGIQAFMPDVDGTPRAASPLVPLTPTPALLDVSIWFQGFVVETSTLTAQETQIATVQLRAND